MTGILVIFLAFSLIHSITVASWFGELCRRAFGEIFLLVWCRSLCTMVSVINATVARYLIALPPDRVLWEPPLWLRWILRVQLAGCLFGLQAFQYLDAGAFPGFRQVRCYLVRGEIRGNQEGLKEGGLVATGVYGIVRHPLCVAGIIIFTFSPRITVNGMTITVLADLYILFGMFIMFIEERRSISIFGDECREYRKQVP